MTTIRPFTCEDLFRYNNVNLDPLTETYGLSFYLQYLAHWPEYFQVAEAPNGDIMGYIMGKAEGHSENWHGHVTALTVAPEYRRLGLAATLMNGLEDISEKKKSIFCRFVCDPDEDAFDMRKALSRDINKKSVIPLAHPVRPEDIE
ncbi:n-alpha-acetyltransferase 20 [Caerostris extrusa]|uniref:N-alpha-acetyltransferase 20 n=1 Tax=Caerostris extrusa TaxID=172846 RepID=A0AAV4V424_CAEEX|nr:n-alpha-acetyltransferase 20 [Caerostris extrusa]